MTKTGRKTPNKGAFHEGADVRRGGGKKGRSGRRPFRLTLLAQEIFDKYKLMEVAKDIAVGDIWEEYQNRDGETVSGPTKNSDRLAAIKFIAAYGYGQPVQPIDTSAEMPHEAALAALE